MARPLGGFLLPVSGLDGRQTGANGMKKKTSTRRPDVRVVELNRPGPEAWEQARPAMVRILVGALARRGLVSQNDRYSERGIETCAMQSS
jgi:hypothetical protein